MSLYNKIYANIHIKNVYSINLFILDKAMYFSELVCCTSQRVFEVIK